MSVAEHGLQPGDQGGRTRAGDHLENRVTCHQVLLGDLVLYIYLRQELEAEKEEISHVVNDPLWQKLEQQRGLWMG